MKEVTREILTPTTFFVAFDGKEFDDEGDCIEYEGAIIGDKICVSIDTPLGNFECYTFENKLQYDIYVNYEKYCGYFIIHNGNTNEYYCPKKFPAYYIANPSTAAAEPVTKEELDMFVKHFRKN